MTFLFLKFVLDIELFDIENVSGELFLLLIKSHIDMMKNVNLPDDPRPTGHLSELKTDWTYRILNFPNRMTS